MRLLDLVQYIGSTLLAIFVWRVISELGSYIEPLWSNLAFSVLITILLVGLFDYYGLFKPTTVG